MTYHVELVWNREFYFVPYGESFDSLDKAIRYARALENMGDGEAVKKTRVLNGEGKVVWANGQMVQ